MRLRRPVLALPQPGAARWRGPLRARSGVRDAGRDGARARLARARRPSATLLLGPLRRAASPPSDRGRSGRAAANEQCGIGPRRVIERSGGHAVEAGGSSPELASADQLPDCRGGLRAFRPPAVSPVGTVPAGVDEYPAGRRGRAVSLQSRPMPDYDAIVIGAGHNGLTAAAVMARGGLRVLCLEKNHFIGGMASTTELIRGYRFELAGSIQFPVPNEIFEDLELGSCPIYEPEVQSASIGERRPAADLPLLGPRAAARAPGRDARDRGGARAWPRWRRGPRRRPGPSAASTCASRRSRSTRCGPAPPTRPSARPSAPPCSAA